MKLGQVRLLVSDMGVSSGFHKDRLGEPSDRPDRGARIADLRDPDGNLLELSRDIEWVRPG